MELRSLIIGVIVTLIVATLIIVTIIRGQIVPTLQKAMNLFGF